MTFFSPFAPARDARLEQQEHSGTHHEERYDPREHPGRRHEQQEGAGDRADHGDRNPAPQRGGVTAELGARGSRLDPSVEPSPLPSRAIELVTLADSGGMPTASTAG